ncbi:HNH endonuclease [Candidatus Microgenomates bacterium]|nr:HNH endonuclease [Candidatus Microgenomates bacterium]
MKKLKLTNGRFTMVDDNTYGLLMQHKWTIDRSKKGYVIATDMNLYERRMHRLIAGAKPGESVDHIDGNPLNNQYTNLRICTHQQNCYNRKLNKNNTSGYKGVSWNRFIGKYTAQIKRNGKQIILGYFQDKKEAAFAYNEAAKKYYREFASLNKL